MVPPVHVEDGVSVVVTPKNCKGSHTNLDFLVYVTEFVAVHLYGYFSQRNSVDVLAELGFSKSFGLGKNYEKYKVLHLPPVNPRFTPGKLVSLPGV